MTQMSPAWLTLSAVAAAIAVAAGNLTHFTWWVVLQFVLLTALTGIGIGERFVVTFAVQSLLTIMGILTMSTLGCTLLNDAARDLGAAYVPLNFLVHYTPLLVVFAAPPCKPPTHIFRQVLNGVGLFVAYIANRPALDTYGCDMPLWPVVLAAVASIVIWSQPDAQSLLYKCVYQTSVVPKQPATQRQGIVRQRHASRKQPKQQYKARRSKMATPPTTAAISKFM